MKALTRLISVVFVIALVLPGFALAQGRMAQIDEAKQLLETNPTQNNRLRLATLQYLEGVDAMTAGNSESAVDNMQQSVWTLEDGDIPGSNPVFEEARYGLAYALWEGGKPYEALMPLEQLLEASPDVAKGQYLKAMILTGLGAEKSAARAREIFRELGSGSSAMAPAGARAATRLHLDQSTLVHAMGDNAGALEMMNLLLDSVGFDKGETDAENQMVHYADGTYLSDIGDVEGGLKQYETVAAGNADFALSTGVTIGEVLANAYYRAGVSALSYGGKDSAQDALNYFEKSKGFQDTVDVHHGMALAYNLMENPTGVKDELTWILNHDKDYFNRITTMK